MEAGLSHLTPVLLAPTPALPALGSDFQAELVLGDEQRAFVKEMGSSTGGPELQSQFCHILAV